MRRAVTHTATGDSFNPYLLPEKYRNPYPQEKIRCAPGTTMWGYLKGAGVEIAKYDPPACLLQVGPQVRRGPYPVYKCNIVNRINHYSNMTVNDIICVLWWAVGPYQSLIDKEEYKQSEHYQRVCQYHRISWAGYDTLPLHDIERRRKGW